MVFNSQQQPACVPLVLSYLSHVLLKHTQLQTLVEAELTVLPRPLDLVLTLSGREKDGLDH